MKPSTNHPHAVNGYLKTITTRGPWKILLRGVFVAREYRFCTDQPLQSGISTGF
jgi:hypothetical protein